MSQESVSSCVAALGALIRPLSWVGPFLPTLPPCLMDVISAPIPILVGLPYLPEDFEQDEETVLVLLDRETVRVPAMRTRTVSRDVQGAGGADQAEDAVQLLPGFLEIQIPGNNHLYSKLEPLSRCLRHGSGSGTGIDISRNRVRPCYKPTGQQVEACKHLVGSINAHVQGLLRRILASGLRAQAQKDAMQPTQQHRRSASGSARRLPPLSVCSAALLEIVPEGELPFWSRFLQTQLISCFYESRNTWVQHKLATHVSPSSSAAMGGISASPQNGGKVLRKRIASIASPTSPLPIDSIISPKDSVSVSASSDSFPSSVRRGNRPLQERSAVSYKPSAVGGTHMDVSAASLGLLGLGPTSANPAANNTAAMRRSIDLRHISLGLADAAFTAGAAARGGRRMPAAAPATATVSIRSSREGGTGSHRAHSRGERRPSYGGVTDEADGAYGYVPSSVSRHPEESTGISRHSRRATTGSLAAVAASAGAPVSFGGPQQDLRSITPGGRPNSAAAEAKQGSPTAGLPPLRAASSTRTGSALHASPPVSTRIPSGRRGSDDRGSVNSIVEDSDTDRGSGSGTAYPAQHRRAATAPSLPAGVEPQRRPVEDAVVDPQTLRAALSESSRMRIVPGGLLLPKQ